MNAQQVANSAMEILMALNENSYEKVQKVLQNSNDFLENRAIYAAATLYKMAIENSTKKSGKGDQLAVCKRMIKIYGKNGRGTDGAGIFTNSTGKFCIMNGYYAFRMNDDIAGVQKAKQPYDLNRIINPAMRFEYEEQQMKLPTPQELKSYIKGKESSMTKSEKNAGVLWYFDKDHAVNAKYLLDCILMLGDGIKMWSNWGNEHCYYYCRSDLGDGVLMPVNTKREN